MVAGPIAEVTGMALVDYDLDKFRYPQFVRQLPCLRFVDPHKRCMQDEAALHT
jgi:hypothetical protein